MNLKSLVKMAKSSTYATSPKFSLKTLIDNNLEIKDQKVLTFVGLCLNKFIRN